MEVELRGKPISDALNTKDMEVKIFHRNFVGSSGTGTGKISVTINLSSEDEGVLNQFGAENFGDKRNFTLKEITTLGDFEEKTEDAK